ncbi:hypothetical protein [Streptomyces daghestanicus]|uniref:RES domain-containing protein n=1 Tax=Streptomyces daghestanicus TaxID=66885 RepID=A0ABQ3QCY6_9ACTN|nr:hypothetical protein [Streptomyces daghestanicus]GGU14790.1 hypothetical protein GCM10010259_01220 [Streptomyces daghestanicus]GHI35104.1 hypothetical protein Sdagh_68340 [Streptomyces daghestanicus]
MPSTAGQSSPGTTEVLRVMSDPRTPVFATEYMGGRRRYGYWRPMEAGGPQGGCYVALPTAVCEELHAAGRITLGDPIVDPAKTTYRVAPVPPRSAAARARRHWARAA